jgi:hypothetical protein
MAQTQISSPQRTFSDWCSGLFLAQILKVKNTLGLSGEALLHPSNIIRRGFLSLCLSLLLAVQVIESTRISLYHRESSRNFHCGLYRRHIRVQTNLPRPFLRFSRLRQHRPPRPCLRYPSLESISKHIPTDHGVRNLTPPKFSRLYPNPTPVDPSRQLPNIVYRHFLTRVSQPNSTIVDLATHKHTTAQSPTSRTLS